MRNDLLTIKLRPRPIVVGDDLETRGPLPRNFLDRHIERSSLPACFCPPCAFRTRSRKQRAGSHHHPPSLGNRTGYADCIVPIAYFPLQPIEMARSRDAHVQESLRSADLVVRTQHPA